MVKYSYAFLTRAAFGLRPFLLSGVFFFGSSFDLSLNFLFLEFANLSFPLLSPLFPPLYTSSLPPCFRDLNLPLSLGLFSGLEPLALANASATDLATTYRNNSQTLATVTFIGCHLFVLQLSLFLEML